MLQIIKKNPLTTIFTLFTIIFLIAEYKVLGDFSIFLLASEALGNGEDIYAIRYLYGFQYFYSPLFAVLLYPLTLIPKEAAGLIWNLLSFGMLARTFVLIRQLFIPSTTLKLTKLQLIVALAMIFPIYSNFHATQMSAFILYAILESINLIIYKKKYLLGGALLALAINIKLLPLVFIPYFVYRKKFSAVLYTLIFTVIYLIAPIPFLGFETNYQLHLGWLETINPLKDANIIDLNERGLHSLTSLISTWFTDYRNPYELTYRRHIMLLDIETIGLIINTARLALVLFTIYFLRTMPFQPAKSKLHRFWEVSYLSILIPLIFPHQQVYAFYLLLPAAYYVIYYLTSIKLAFDKSWKINLIYSLAILAFLFINLELILGLYRKVFWFYKLLSYGSLLLLVVLTICHPKYLENKIEKSN